MGKYKKKGILKTLGYWVLALVVAGAIGAGTSLIAKNIDTIREKLGINKPTEKPVDPIEPDDPLIYTVKITGVGEKDIVKNVIANGYITELEEPTKEGYQFNGFMLNGKLVDDVTQIKVNKNLIFTASWSKILPYEFDGGVLVKYFGSETSIFKTPQTYSLGKKEVVNLGTYSTMNDLDEYIKTLNTYPLTLVAGEEQKFEIKNLDDFIELKIKYAQDTTTVKFPVLVKKYKQTYIEGQDNQVTTIGANAFAEVENLLSITISEGITTLNNSAFKDLNQLSRIDFPSTLTTIGESAFENCTALTALDFPENLTDIRQRAFYNTKLRLVALPNSVTTIGEDAFSNCTSLWEFALSRDFNNNSKSFLKNCTQMYSLVVKSDIENKAKLLEGVNSEVDLTMYVPDEKLSEYITATQLQYPKLVVNNLSNVGTTNNPTLHSVVVVNGDGTAKGYVVEHRGKLPFLNETVEGKELDGAYFLNKNTNIYLTGQPQDADISSSSLAWELEDYFVIDNIIINPRYIDITERAVIPFVFANGVLTKYTGSEENVTVPASYSEKTTEIEKGFENKVALDNWLKIQNLVGNFTITGTFTGGLAGEEYVIYNSYSSFKKEAYPYLVNGQVTFNGKIKQYTEGSSFVVTTIGANAFTGEDAFNIKKVTLPSTVTVIENSAFDSRSLLEEINLENVVTIGNDAFLCTNIKTVTFGINCQSIGSNVFGGVGQLNKVIFKSENLPEITGGIANMADCSSPAYYVADEFYDNYVNDERCSSILSKLHRLSELEEA